MSLITQLCNVNLIPGDVPPIIHVKQYDTGLRTLIFTVYNGESVFAIPSDATVKCEGTKPDKKGFSYEVTFDGSEVTVDLEPQMTAVGGRAICQLTIGQNDGILGTANFILDIEPAALGDDTVLSESDLATVTQLVNTATDAAENAANDASAAAQSATDAESSAASAATSASEAASAAENAVAGKADKTTPSAAGNVALLSSDGNLQDSGKQFTPAGIGAAPDGYGLGTTQGMDIPTNESGARDLNLATNNGWYYIYNSENYVNFPGSSEGGPNAGYHAMRVDAFRGVTQTIYMGYQTWAGCIAIRHKNFSSSSWGNWCWINPPMTTGISYRTLEIFNGKPVYKMAISCGAMPSANSTKTVSHGIYNIEAIVSYGGYMNAGGNTSLSIPFRNSATNYGDISVDYAKITLVAGATSLSAYTESTVWFAYTLTTD